MAKKLTLDVISMQEDFFEGTYLMGLVCGYPPASLVWHINDALNLHFHRDWQADMQLIKPRTKNVIHFPIYQYAHGMSGVRHILYYLKSGRDRLLPELRNMDYLWLIQGATAEEDIQRYAQAAAKISGIQLVQIIPVEKLQNAHHLLV